MNYKVGDWVRYIGSDGKRFNDKYYPCIGTIGTVTSSAGCAIYVQWPKGSTTKDDHWAVADHCIEPYLHGEWGASCNPSFEELTGFVEGV